MQILKTSIKNNINLLHNVLREKTSDKMKNGNVQQKIQFKVPMQPV